VPGLEHEDSEYLERALTDGNPLKRPALIASIETSDRDIKTKVSEAE
jgi:hypothetical protein